MHGWMDDDMSVAPTADPPFHFYNVDLVVDHLVAHNVTPVFELDYMPRSMAKCKGGPNKCYYVFHNNGGYKGLLEPPANYAQWGTLINALASHLVERYGIDEILRWNFEVWNEPNPWIGGVDYPGEYLNLYNASAHALKSVDARIRVGGPATATLGHVTDFARRAAEMPIDFISSHLYPSEAPCTDPSQPYGRDPDCFAKLVLNASRSLRKVGGLPLYLTEYKEGLHGGPGTGYAGSHGDTSYAAAFIIRTVPMLSQELELLSWWTFSDVFDEGWLTGVPFYGGYGLLNTQGVAKPAFRAFELLNGAGSRRLRGVTVHDPLPDYPHIANHSTVSVLATLDDEEEEKAKEEGNGGRAASSSSLQLFLANFAPEKGATGAPWVAKARNVSVVLSWGQRASSSSSSSAHHQGTTDHPYRCAGGPLPSRALMRRIDDHVTNPRHVWEATQGAPPYPTRQQLADLHAASAMPQQALQLVVSPANCTAAFELELPPNGVAHVSAFV